MARCVTLSVEAPVAVLRSALIFVFTSSAMAAPTFYQDVAPILQAHCVSCHRPGEIAPMSLITYDQVRPWVASIKEAVMSVSYTHLDVYKRQRQHQLQAVRSEDNRHAYRSHCARPDDVSRYPDRY